MADAWTVVVTREPEWDDYDRAEAIAAVYEAQTRCHRGHSPDQMVELVTAERNVRWPDGRLFRVRQFRCLGCASVEFRERESQRTDPKPVEGVYAPSDGRRTIADEIFP